MSKPICVYTRVNLDTALAAGYVNAGEGHARVTPQLLAKLTPLDREVLARYSHVEGATSPSRPLLVALPTEEALVDAIRAEADELRKGREKQDAEAAEVAELAALSDDELIERDESGKWVILDRIRKLPYRARGRDVLYQRAEAVMFDRTFRSLDGQELTRALLDGWRKGPSHGAEMAGGKWLEMAHERTAQLEAERAAAAAARERAKKEAEARNAETIREFVEQFGTASQQGRLAAGHLPESELADLVRSRLFAPLADYPRYVKLATDDVDCEDECFDSRVAFYTEDPEHVPLSEIQWFILGRIKKAAEQSELTVQVRRHVAECESCEAVTSRLAARVSIDWAGLHLSREYSLDVDAVDGEDVYECATCGLLITDSMPHEHVDGWHGK